MSTKNDQITDVARYVRLSRELARRELTEDEQAEYADLGRQLAMVRGDAALRLVADPAAKSAVLAALKS